MHAHMLVQHPHVCQPGIGVQNGDARTELHARQLLMRGQQQCCSCYEGGWDANVHVLEQPFNLPLLLGLSILPAGFKTY